MYSHPSAPIQILTVDTRKPCGFLCRRLHDDGRPLQRKSRIERRFESSPESRGSQTSGVLLVLFVQAKRIKPFPFREARGSANLESAYPNNSFPLTKLKPFPKEDSRFCKPRIRTHKQQLLTNKIKSFCRSAAFQGGIAAKRVPCRERFHTFC